jgi:hypothetical protein
VKIAEWLQRTGPKVCANVAARRNRAGGPGVTQGARGRRRIEGVVSRLIAVEGLSNRGEPSGISAAGSLEVFKSLHVHSGEIVACTLASSEHIPSSRSI